MAIQNKSEFLKAKGVFVYPSSNADDGGDVNSEFNLAGITEKLISKNFVILRDSKVTPLPLHVTLSGTRNLLVTYGEAVIEGYYVKVSSQDESEDSGVINIKVTSDHCVEFSKYFGTASEYARLYSQLHSIETLPKEERETLMESLRDHSLFLVLSLKKNTTGHVRGDASERDPENFSSLIRVNKGVAFSFKRGLDIDSLDLPLAQIIVKPSDSGTIVIEAVNNEVILSKYAYINVSKIYTRDGDLLEEWIINFFKEGLDSLDTITFKSDSKTCVTVKDHKVRVIRYKEKIPKEYDEEGNPVYEEDNGFDQSYSVDEIQGRSHVASPSQLTYDPFGGSAPPLNDSGMSVSEYKRLSGGSRDLGDGYHNCAIEDTVHQKITKNFNGNSRLLSRADHNHDKRYIRSSAATKLTDEKDQWTDEIQTILTNLEVLGGLRAKRGLTVTGGILSAGGSFINGLGIDLDGSPVEGSAYIEGNINSGRNIYAEGDIVGSRVFNAVWNDYAELYLKDIPGLPIEPGTVICKIKGRDTYAPTTSASNLVVGVSSDSYGHLLGGDKGLSLKENLKKYVPVALAGRVSVRVAPGVCIEEGDLLVSAPDGRATLAKYHGTGFIVGKALESTDGTKDKILMQVMLS